MIPMMARVRNMNEVRVKYGTDKPDDVVPAGSLGITVYREEEMIEQGTVGIQWMNADGTPLPSVEVKESELEVLIEPAVLTAILGHLRYSWKDIGFLWDGLTQEERLVMPPEAMNKLVHMIGETKHEPVDPKQTIKFDRQDFLDFVDFVTSGMVSREQAIEDASPGIDKLLLGGVLHRFETMMRGIAKQRAIIDRLEAEVRGKVAASAAARAKKALKPTKKPVKRKKR